MATASNNRLHRDEDGNYAVEDKDYPGHTVDALLEQGKVEEARAELERLILEGVESGDPVEMAPQKWRELRINLHRQAGIA